LSIPVVFNSEELVVYSSKDTIDNEPTFLFVEEPATFQGGDVNDFRSYIQRALIYPKKAAKAGIKGKVIVQFVVDSNGFLVDSKIIRSVDPCLDMEALRCIDNSPRWVPARQGGKPVRQQFVIPVSFILQ
jgi:protein TonB